MMQPLDVRSKSGAVGGDSKLFVIVVSYLASLPMAAKRPEATRLT